MVENQAIGLSRGGRTTKIHALVDGLGNPLGFRLTGGQVHDTLMTFFDINLMNFISVCDSTKFLVFEYFLRLPSH